MFTPAQYCPGLVILRSRREYLTNPYCLPSGSHEAMGRLSGPGSGKGPTNLLHCDSANEGEALAQYQTNRRKPRIMDTVIETGKLEEG